MSLYSRGLRFPSPFQAEQLSDSLGCVSLGLGCLLLYYARDKAHYLSDISSHPWKKWVNSNNGNSYHPFWLHSLWRNFNQDFSLMRSIRGDSKCNLILIRIQLSFTERPFLVRYWFQSSAQPSSPQMDILAF